MFISKFIFICYTCKNNFLYISHFNTILLYIYDKSTKKLYYKNNLQKHPGMNLNKMSSHFLVGCLLVTTG